MNTQDAVVSTPVATEEKTSIGTKAKAVAKSIGIGFAKGVVQGVIVAAVTVTARSILERGANLTSEERLAFADRTRAMSPGLHDVDMAAMIRKDRDER